MRINELWAIVALEHVLIFLKMCLSACIEDKPAWVVEAEKRDHWEKERKEQMNYELAKQNSDLDVSSILNSVANFRPEPPKGPAPGKGGIVGEGFVPEERM